MSHEIDKKEHCCTACAELHNISYSDGHSHNHNHDHDHNHTEKPEAARIITYIIGVILFIAAFILEKQGFSQILYISCYILSYLTFGYDIIIDAVKNLLKGSVLDENFLMSAASVGALFIGEYPEAIAVMIFFKVGEYFEHSAVKKSKKSITDLMDIRPDYANLVRNNEILKVSPEDVKIGDYILVKPGEKIPLDGVIQDGETTLDTSALTGESKPRDVFVNDTVLSGCINKVGVITIKVTKPFSESTVSKIINMVETASSKKAKTENFITGFSKYYTPCVVSIAVLLGIIPPLFTGFNFSEWINRGLIFLVISCPCALVISIPLSFFSGIGLASKNGILIKGSNYLEGLNELRTVVFDKTGTLTKGEFSVSQICPENGYSKEELLEICAYAECYSNHPIGLSVLKAYGKDINKSKISEYKEFSGQGVSAKIDGKNILAGNGKILGDETKAKIDKLGTSVFVMVDDIYAGCIIISDQIKEDSINVTSLLKKKGIEKNIMLTGDNRETAELVCKKLKLDEYYAELLPDEKVMKIEEILAKSNGKTAFVGDGINDAPVLARADIGVAMGGIGSDASIEAADIVIMTDEPSKLAAAIDIAKVTKKIVWQNIIFILAIKVLFLILGACGIATMWEAVFADVGVSVVAILNSMRIPRIFK